MSVSMTFGGYSFDPVPQLTLNIEHIRDEVGNLINLKHTATLNGQLVALGKDSQGPAVLLGLQDDMRIALSNCSGDCQLFSFTCDSTQLISAYARATNLEFSPSQDNWVFTSNYSVNLEWDALSDNILMAATGEIDTSCYSCLVNTNEDWQLQLVQTPIRFYLSGCSGERNRDALEITHTVSAKGMNCCVSGESGPIHTAGWENAKAWVENRLGFDSGILGDASGVFGFNPTDFTAYNHSRTNQINKTTGDFSVTETWTVLGSTGIPACIEEFTVEVTTDLTTSFTTVNINGTITGMESRNANFQLTKTKFESARECWENEIEPLLYARATCLSNNLICPLRSTPARTSVLQSPAQGTISYNYTYDSKVQLIPGSLSESVSVNDTLASEQVAQIPIIGRRAGPILYATGSNNPLERRVSIGILMRQSGCPTGTPSGILCQLYHMPPTGYINSLLCCLENDLYNNYTSVYRTQDSQSFSILDGQYSREVTWLYSKCSGISAPQRFC